MNYGHFKKDGKEYIITNPRTPAPWINYLYNGRYFTTISNNGGGISYYKSPLHGRITRYRINEVPPDRPGKYLYLKDRDTGEYWSLTWQPVGKYPDAYTVVHGFGYTRAEAKVNGVESTVLFFVPQSDDQELWKVTLRNISKDTKRLSLTGYLEMALGHALIDLINQCDDQHFNRSYFDPGLNAIFSTKTYWVTQTAGTQQQENKEWDQWTFFTVNQNISGYETVRERFLGPYRNENNPEGIENSLSNLDTDFGNVVNALQTDLELLPGEEKHLVFSLGVINKAHFDEEKSRKVTKYHSVEATDLAFQEVMKSWEKYFAFTNVSTPDEPVNLFLNYWLPYQAKVAFDVGRVVSFYYWGIGRGFGFRDTSQDTIALTISNPNKARERILLLSRQMRKDGKVFHHFHEDGKGEFTHHCDDPLWFLLAVTEYLKETGDLELLKHKEPFIDAEPDSILSHMFSVVEFARNNLGKHGLPVFGRGDWNDTLDYIGGEEGGESVWGAMFYAGMLKLFQELLEFLNMSNEASDVAGFRKSLIHAVEEYCWDGSWYIRAFGEKDKKVGSHKSRFGKIFLNTQIWPVIAGFPDNNRLVIAMDSVKQLLDSPEGPKKCTPAWKEIDPSIGLVTRCVWGKKENGAVFCHPSAWVIQAEAMLGRGNNAYDYLIKMLPNRIDSDIFKAEPYVYSQYITSNEHSSPGRASHSWQTGTAAWMFRVCYDYVFGIRPTYNGLMVDPVIPSHWNQLKVKRVFRSAQYLIEIENPNQVEKGVKRLVVDGKTIEGNIIPISSQPVCNVKVLM